MRLVYGPFILQSSMVIKFKKKHFCSGHWATVVLQIPVVGGYQGGRISVDHPYSNVSKKIMDLSEASDRSFNLTIIQVDSLHQMEPITSGWRIELVYNIFWKPPSHFLFASLPLKLPSFLVALAKLRSELAPWVLQTVH